MFYNAVKNRLLRRRHCEHDFKKVGEHMEPIGYGEHIQENKYKCDKCNKKERRVRASSGTFVLY